MKDSTILGATYTSVDGTERGVCRDFSRMRELFPQALKEALASLGALISFVAYGADEGKVEAAILIIKSILDFENERAEILNNLS